MALLSSDIPDQEQDSLSAAPAIRIDGVTYSYPGGAEVLHGIDLTLEAGTTTALVGTSGAGKSTLAALVAGLQYPTTGTIHLDAVDTATVPNTWVTEHVALITQEVHLFSGTLRDDLLLALPGASDAQLWAALHKSAWTSPRAGCLTVSIRSSAQVTRKSERRPHNKFRWRA